MEIQDLLKLMVEFRASELFLTAARQPMCRIAGDLQPISEHVFTPADLELFSRSIMNEAQRREFSEKMEMNLTTALPEVCRFRVNIYRQRGSVGVVIKKVAVEIPSLDALELPPVVKELSLENKGLVFVVGTAGAGKSTTLAAMIDHRNSNRAGHIIAIEDPIEFAHSHKRCIVTQREVGSDTQSFHEALKNAVQQSPDVIVISEIRDAETMEAALGFASSGFLCIAALPTANARQAIEHILTFCPPAHHPQMLLQLSVNLTAIIAQKLISADDGRRIAAVEVVLGIPDIQELIKNGEFDNLGTALEKNSESRCQSFDQAISLLYRQGRISTEQALANAEDIQILRAKMKPAANAQEEGGSARRFAARIRGL